MKTITIVEVNNVMDYPPIISLVENLLKNGHRVKLIGYGINGLPAIIKNNKFFSGIAFSLEERGDGGKNFLRHIYRRTRLSVEAKKIVKQEMKDADILWTTSSNTVRILGKEILRYKNVMQLMELMQYGYWYKKLIKYPIDELARRSWKVVVAEENRAYIEKAWWNLPKVPYVLPNKPYYLECKEITDELKEGIAKISNEKRKILLYLGGIWPDRDLKPFVEATDKMGSDYCVYIIGKAFGEDAEHQLEEMVKKENVEYLGFYEPPKHLAFLKYAYIGLLPYRTTSEGIWSELNALYCAPNKIYEYAGFGIPMLGTDVLGLKQPFEKYDIGKCCDERNVNNIISAIEYINSKYEEMAGNCKNFYEDTNLDNIVNNILSD